MRVCIIDDNSIILDSMALVMEDDGHDVVTAANGTEGLALLDVAACDAVVIDLNLPRVRGDEIAAFARARHADLVIALVSGEPIANRDLLGSVVDIFLQKPFTPKALMAALARAQQQRRAAASGCVTPRLRSSS